jgi:hypothetical protein
VNDCRKSHSGLFVGILITSIGVIFLLDQMGVVPARFVFREFWPVVMILVGLRATFRSGHFSGSLWGPVLVLLGSLWLLNNLAVTHLAIGRLWPLWMIAVGVWMLLRASGHVDWPPYRPPFSPGGTRSYPHRHDWRTRGVDPTRQSWAGSPAEGPATGDESSVPPATAQPTSAEDVDETFQQAAILSGIKRRIRSQNFRFAKVSTVLGGFQLDFTHAGMVGPEATVDVESVFGGGEIRIPETWSVKIETSSVAGAVVDETYRRPDASPPSKRLVIRGTVVFGGVVIKN